MMGWPGSARLTAVAAPTTRAEQDTVSGSVLWATTPRATKSRICTVLTVNAPSWSVRMSSPAR
ncbi:hypothetical protein ACWEPN_21150 [Nonomuraea wenchangensis]